MCLCVNEVSVRKRLVSRFSYHVILKDIGCVEHQSTALLKQNNTLRAMKSTSDSICPCDLTRQTKNTAYAFSFDLFKTFNLLNN